MSYILSCLIWSAVGFFLGTRYGQLERKVIEIERQHVVSTPEDPIDPVISVKPPRKRPAWHVPTLDRQRMFGFILVLLALATVYYVHRTEQCVTAFYQDTVDALQARDAASGVSRVSAKTVWLADKGLWLGLLQNARAPGTAETPEQRAASLAVLNHYLDSVDRYVAAIDASGTAAARFPLPDIRCG